MDLVHDSDYRSCGEPVSTLHPCNSEEKDPYKPEFSVPSKTASSGGQVVVRVATSEHGAELDNISDTEPTLQKRRAVHARSVSMSHGGGPLLGRPIVTHM